MDEPISLRFEFAPDALAIMAKMRAFPEDMLAAIARGVNKSGPIALGEITAKRFTGKGPFAVIEGRLGVRTNRLRSSLRWTPAVVDGRKVVGGSIGSNVRYLGLHEFGFSGSVQVKAHSRKASIFGKQSAGETMKVKAHSRMMRVPARAPLGHGMTDSLPGFTKQLVRELATTWENLNQ